MPTVNTTDRRPETGLAGRYLRFLAALGLCLLGAVGCSDDDAPAPPSARAKPMPPRPEPPTGFREWLAQTFEQPRCTFTVTDVPSVATVQVRASFTNRPGHATNTWSFPLMFQTEGDGWDCHRPDNPEMRCELTMVQCEKPVPRPTQDVAASANPAKKAPRCMKKAKALIKEGEACDLDMSRYSPEIICAFYLVTEKMTDNEIVQRLDGFLDDGCRGLHAAVVGDRI